MVIPELSPEEIKWQNHIPSEQEIIESITSIRRSATPDLIEMIKGTIQLAKEDSDKLNANLRDYEQKYKEKTITSTIWGQLYESFHAQTNSRISAKERHLYPVAVLAAIVVDNHLKREKEKNRGFYSEDSF